MPGIVGLISRYPPEECRRRLSEMVTCLEHEPFHTSGSYSVPEMGVYVGWVADKGSFADAQPIMNDRQNIAIVVTGECFTHSSPPARFGVDGRRGRHGDAGWLVDGYEAERDRFFGALNGLFSGIVIDARERRAVLFNDRYGMERVYYHEGPSGFFFATEAKALLRILAELRRFDDEGLVDFLTYGCTLNDRTLFHAVNMLPAASSWSFGDGRCDRRQYFDPTTLGRQPTKSLESFERSFQDTFRRILPRYLQPDGEIGISLTGGLDTRLILACHPRLARLVSYTFAGAEGETLDVRLARRVAAACDIPHEVIRLSDEWFAHFADFADRTVYLTDGYVGVCGAHEIYLNRQARTIAPIRLTGNYGSEVLRGMTTFKPLALAPELFHSDLRRRLSAAPTPWTSGVTHPVRRAVFEEAPWSLFGVARAAQSQVRVRTPYLDNELVALAFQAPDEVRRSPGPAMRLITHDSPALGMIPTDRGQVPSSPRSSVMRAMLYRGSFKVDYWLNEGTPDWFAPLDRQLFLRRLYPSWIGHHKYLHYRRWFQGQLAKYLREQLADSSVIHSGLWNKSFLDRMADRHISGRRNYVGEINMVLTLAAIDRLLFGQFSGTH
jgi:asparagine synthase (glutamine-hydrolysing)